MTPPAPQRILIIKPSALGDVVTAMPVPGIFRLATWASQSGGRAPGP